MKKTLITIALALTVSAGTVLAQGTVNFQNSFLTPIRTNSLPSPGTGGTVGAMSTVASAFSFQLFWGLDNAQLTNSSSVFFNGTSTAGVLAGSSLLALANAPASSSVFYQLVGWSTAAGSAAAAQITGGALYGISPILNIPTLASASGPGSVLFGTGAGTQINTTSGTGNFMLFTTAVPEPSTMVLAGLGAASLLLFRRRKLA